MADLEFPDNWTWSAAPVEPGPAVLVDVDGVIANGWHRQHHLQNGRKDWKAFFDDAHMDDPIDGSIELLDQFDAGLRVVLLTARPDNLRAVTREWVIRHGYRWEVLVMPALESFRRLVPAQGTHAERSAPLPQPVD